MDTKLSNYNQTAVVLKHCRRFLEYIEISLDEDHNLNMYKENIRKYFYPANEVILSLSFT